MLKFLIIVSTLVSIGAALWYVNHSRVDLGIYYSIWVLINIQWIIHEPKERA